METKTKTKTGTVSSPTETASESKQQTQPQTAAASQEQPVPRKIRGVLTIKREDDLEFRADRKTGISSQEEIKKEGDSKLYRTVGEKQQKLVMHITVPSDSCDPRAEFLQKADSLTREMESKAQPKLRGTVLMDDEDLRIVLNKRERKLQVVFDIDLEKTPAYNNRLINLMQRTSQCFAINQTSLVKPRS